MLNQLTFGTEGYPDPPLPSGSATVIVPALRRLYLFTGRQEVYWLHIGAKGASVPELTMSQGHQTGSRIFRGNSPSIHCFLRRGCVISTSCMGCMLGNLKWLLTKPQSGSLYSRTRCDFVPCEFGTSGC